MRQNIDQNSFRMAISMHSEYNDEFRTTLNLTIVLSLSLIDSLTSTNCFGSRATQID